MTQDHSRSANRLLAALPEDEYNRLKPYLVSESLTVGTVFYEASAKIETIYFPNRALVSLVNTQTELNQCPDIQELRETKALKIQRKK